MLHIASKIQIIIKMKLKRLLSIIIEVWKYEACNWHYWWDIDKQCGGITYGENLY